jgi:tRNA(Ile)-lysidine synthase
MSHSTDSAMVAIRSAVRAELTRCSSGEKVIVACSGGADSLALSYAVAKEAGKLALSVIGVTIDHQLQIGSRAQAEIVIAQLHGMGIIDAEIRTVAVAVTDGVEASARRARYDGLEAARSEHGATWVLLGHTRDDQAESVLLGLARGSGTRSLSGMAIRNGNYLRPLLAITRGETVAACREKGLTVWEDPHNSDRQYLRVRVRKQALPALEESIGPGVSAALARSAQLLRDDADALDSWAMREFDQIDWRLIEVDSLVRLPRAIRTRLFRMAIYAAGAPGGTISADHVGAVEALVTSWRGQGEVSLPGGVKVSRKSGRLSLLPPSHESSEAPWI